MALKAVKRDLLQITRTDDLFFLVKTPEEIESHPEDDSPILKFIIDPPGYGPYSKLLITVTFIYPPNYPFKEPTMLLDPPIPHPNIHKYSGEVALEFSQWTSLLRTKDLLCFVWNLLLLPIDKLRTSEEKEIYLESLKGSDISSIELMSQLINQVNYIYPKDIRNFMASSGRDFKDDEMDLYNLNLDNFNCNIYQELGMKVTKISKINEDESWKDVYLREIDKLSLSFN